MAITYRRVGWKYVLDAPATYALPARLARRAPTYTSRFLRLDQNGLTIREGYAWDGPSGPTWDTPGTIRGSLPHDALYQLIRLAVLPPSARRSADWLMLRCLKDEGVNAGRRWLYYVAVRWFAANAARRPETGS